MMANTRPMSYNSRVMKETKHGASFPVPKFLLFSSVGLDISDQSIKYAELVRMRGGLELGRFGSVAVPPGVIASGKIQDSKKLITILSDLKMKEKIQHIRVSLPEEQLYLFKMRIPAVPGNQVRNTIELQLEEHIPIKAPETVFDYRLIAEYDDVYDLQVSALPEETVESYLSVFRAAELEPLSFELEMEALARAVVPLGDVSTIMIVDFGETRTGISVVSGHIILFTTTLDLGGTALTASIQKALNVSFSEAEKLKKSEGLARGGNQEVFSILLNSLSILRDEINKNYIYWHTHKDEEGKDRPNIEEIILCGGDANLIGLVDYLAASLHVRVTLADPWVNINSLERYIPDIRHEEILGYATALGLALGDYYHD